MTEVPRDQMPQIDEKDMAKAIVFFSNAGFGVLSAGFGHYLQFSTHQKVDKNKAAAMPDSVLDKPVLVTRLNEVIDGNHRVAAHRIHGSLVPFIQIDCSFVDALDILNVFPFAYELKALTPERN